jgi:hypothetical protein
MITVFGTCWEGSISLETEIQWDDAGVSIAYAKEN